MRVLTRRRSKEQILEEFRVASIKDAAMHVIARKGISGASMQEIAEEAGIAKGTIYLYFRNQQDLMEATIDHALSLLLAQIEEALDSPGDFRDRFRAVVFSHLEFFDAHHDLFRVYLAFKFPEGADPSSTRYDRANRPQYLSYLERLSDFFEKAMDAGILRRADPQRLGLFVAEGIVAVIIERINHDDPPPVEREVDWITATVLDGVLAPKVSR